MATIKVIPTKNISSEYPSQNLKCEIILRSLSLFFSGDKQMENV
jgi:hypothetical protein